MFSASCPVSSSDLSNKSVCMIHFGIDVSLVPSSSFFSQPWEKARPLVFQQCGHQDVQGRCVNLCSVVCSLVNICGRLNGLADNPLCAFFSCFIQTILSMRCVSYSFMASNAPSKLPFRFDRSRLPPSHALTAWLASLERATGCAGRTSTYLANAIISNRSC